MRYPILGSTLLLCATVLTVGCGSGDGTTAIVTNSSSTNTAVTPTTSTTSVSGTTGSGTTDTTTSSMFSTSMTTAPTATTDTTAVLIVDKNDDGILDSKIDAVYSVPVLTDGSFVFSNVAVNEKKATKAQLTVTKEGFAPVVKTIALQKGVPFTIEAKVAEIPVLTQVISLPDTAAERAGKFLQFGITSTQQGLASFSKLMSLDELQAQADIGLGDGTLTQATIPAAAFAPTVKTVTVNMQAFDSTKKADIEHFPGKFSGHGKPKIGTTATDDTTENALESAAFDLIKLSDQNGDMIELQSISGSKLSSSADPLTCSGMYWERRVNVSQAKVIEAWGDDDNDSTNGFQVPIWSNDNATGSWAYVGEGDWNSTTSSFSACVDTKWEGYLNCDSEISIGTAPKQVCIYTRDQFGDPVSMSFSAKNKGNTYSYGYANGDGLAVLEINDGTPADWNITYSNSWTGWTTVGIDSTGYSESQTEGCDYDLNVTVDNPYSAQIYVFAKENNKTVSGVTVSLYSSSYGDYYYETQETNEKGYALFKAKPNVQYSAIYKGTYKAVNVNGTVTDPETADSGKYASVEVEFVDSAPYVYVYADSWNLTDKAESMNFSVYIDDADGDTVALDSLTLNDTELKKGEDYNISYEYNGGSYLYIQGTLDLNSSTIRNIAPITASSLEIGDYSLSATASANKLSSTSKDTFYVGANTPPVISAFYMKDADCSYCYYYEESTIPVGSYIVDYYVYDNNGDSFIKTITIDGNTYTTGSSISLTKGEHTIVVTAVDKTGLSSSKTTTIFVGNHPPVISSAGSTQYTVDLSKNETFKLYAYVSDAEYSPLSVIATDDANNTYELKQDYFGSKYQSDDIKLTEAKAANKFTIIANDGEDNSTASVVYVESIEGNKAPVFIKELTDTEMNINESKDFECRAEDPEKTFVTYSWKLDDTELGESGEVVTETFTQTGLHTISCTATDEDGESATSTASIVVIDPTIQATLTVHTGYAGLLVSTHDMGSYAPLKTVYTDANGDATFKVTGDRTTFSVALWPGMEVNKEMLMDITKFETLSNAKNNCNESNATECIDADWCALLDDNKIPDWAWDADIDVNGEKPTAKEIDSNGDGSISEDELYAAALSELDDNSDGKLSYVEVTDIKQTNLQFFANVPAQEYFIDTRVVPEAYLYSDIGFYCSDFETANFKTTFNIDYSKVDEESNIYKTLNISGSGYGYSSGITDANKTISVDVSAYRSDSDGKFDYLVQSVDDQGVDSYYFLQDKSETEVKDVNITLDASLFANTNKVVTLVREKLDEYIYVNARYKGLYVDNQSYAEGTDDPLITKSSYYDHEGFEYNIDTYSYTDTMSKTAWRYYTDSTLRDSYDAKDYPLLDININVNTEDGSWSITGSDLAKATVTNFYANINSENNGSVSLTFTWTIVPSQMPNLDLTQIVPSEVVDDVSSVLNSDSLYNNFSYINITELKNMTEEKFLDLLAGKDAYISYYYYDDYGVRTVGSSYNGDSAGYSLNSLSEEDVKASLKNLPLFNITINAMNAFKK